MMSKSKDIHDFHMSVDIVLPWDVANEVSLCDTGQAPDLEGSSSQMQVIQVIETLSQNWEPQ